MAAPGSGQALVEFALTVPLLLTLILGVLDAGRVSVASVALDNAAREAARYGAVHVRDGNWQTVAARRAQDTAVTLDTSRLAVSTATAVAGGATFVVVSASYPFQPATPIIAGAFGAPTIRTTSRMLAP